MLTLYNVPVSIYGNKVHILLRHKGLTWEEVPPPGGYGSAAYKTVVPSGNVPALIDDGLLIADSEAIAEYLDEKHPEPPMLPDSPAARAKARELSRFHDTRLEPEVRALFKMAAPENRETAVLDRQATAINERLTQLAVLVDRRRRPRGAGASPPVSATSEPLPLALGDCGFPGTCAWIRALADHLSMKIDWPGAVTAYLARLEEQEAVAAQMDIYRPVIDRWIETRG